MFNLFALRVDVVCVVVRRNTESLFHFFITAELKDGENQRTRSVGLLPLFLFTDMEQDRHSFKANVQTFYTR